MFLNQCKQYLLSEENDRMLFVEVTWYESKLNKKVSSFVYLCPFVIVELNDGKNLHSQYIFLLRGCLQRRWRKLYYPYIKIQICVVIKDILTWYWNKLIINSLLSVSWMQNLRNYHKWKIVLKSLSKFLHKCYIVTIEALW